jgi:Bacterial regulatory proteins, tetR family.
MGISEERRRLLQSNSAAIHAETIAYIKEALLALMKQKEYDTISMTDIIRKSGVSRAGVYYNYKSKDEICWISARIRLKKQFQV